MEGFAKARGARVKFLATLLLIGIVLGAALTVYVAYEKGVFKGKDKTPPEMSIDYQLTASDGEDLFPDDLIVRYQANEPVKDMQMTISPADKPKERTTFSPKDSAFTVTDIAPGKYYVQVNAKDLAGNPTMRDTLVEVKIPEEYEDLIAAYSVDRAKKWKSSNKLPMITSPEIAKYWQSSAPGNVTFAETLVDGSNNLTSALATAKQVEQNCLDRYWRTDEIRFWQSYHPDQYHVDPSFNFAKYISECLSPEELRKLMEINEMYGWHDVNIVNAQVNDLDLNDSLHRRFLEYRIFSTESEDNGTRLDHLYDFDAFINQPFKYNDPEGTDRGDLAFDAWSALVRDGYEGQLRSHPKLFESAVAVRGPFADCGDRRLRETEAMSYDDLRRDLIADLKYMFDHEGQVRLDGESIALEDYSFDVMQYLTYPGRFIDHNQGDDMPLEHIFNNQEYSEQLLDVCQEYYPELFNSSRVYDTIYGWLPARTPFGSMHSIIGPDEDVNKTLVLRKWIGGLQKLALGEPLNETDGIYGACAVRSGAVGVLLRSLLFPSRDVTYDLLGHTEYYIYLGGKWIGKDHSYECQRERVWVMEPYRANPNQPRSLYAYALKGEKPGVVGQGAGNVCMRYPG